MPRLLKQIGGFLGGFSLVLGLAEVIFYAAGYTIHIDWTDSPGSGAIAPTPLAPATSPPPATVPAVAVATMPPSATVAATATAVAAATATPRPAELDTAGPPFRLLLDGTPTPLTWDTAQGLVLRGTADRLVANRAAIQAWVAPFMQAHNRPAQRAAFRWNPAMQAPEVVLESQTGRAVDQAATVDRLATALETGHGTDIVVPVSPVQPQWTSDQLPSVGAEIIGEGQINYAGDDAATIQNVEQGALALDGAIALPGATFSHDAWVYDGRTYAPSYAIVGERTLLAPGGGLCIVATTLFQTAFWTGLPIVERHNHPYWIGMYAVQYNGQDLKGLDATVGDMRFRNTTGAPLRVHAWTAGDILHIQLIGTRPAWQVRVRDYAITDFQPALSTVAYFDEPSLPKGRQEIARNPHDGFTAALTREVLQGGTVIDSYRVVSRYEVTEKQVMVGTGD